MNVEPVFIMLFVMSAVILILTAIDLLLLAAKVRRKLYFYLNAILQLPVTFIIAGLGGAGPLGIIGIVLFILNVAIIVSLKKWIPEEKKVGKRKTK